MANVCCSARKSSLQRNGVIRVQIYQRPQDRYPPSCAQSSHNSRQHKRSQVFSYVIIASLLICCVHLAGGSSQNLCDESQGAANQGNRAEGLRSALWTPPQPGPRNQSAMVSNRNPQKSGSYNAHCKSSTACLPWTA